MGGIIIKAIIYIVEIMYNFKSIRYNFLKKYYILVEGILLNNLLTLKAFTIINLVV